VRGGNNQIVNLLEDPGLGSRYDLLQICNFCFTCLCFFNCHVFLWVCLDWLIWAYQL